MLNSMSYSSFHSKNRMAVGTIFLADGTASIFAPFCFGSSLIVMEIKLNFHNHSIFVQ